MSREPDFRSADDLWAAGRRSEALALLKTHVRAHPSDDTARMSLVRKYREIDAPDQAGRWGLAIEGFIDDVERDRAVRLLAASGISRDDIAEFLVLPNETLSSEVESLLPFIEERRQARHPRAVQPHERDPFVADIVIGAFALVFVLLAATAVWLVAMLGAPVTQLARWLAVAWLSVLGVAALYFGVRLPRSRRRFLRVGLVVCGLASIAAAVGWVIRAWENSGVFQFTWER